MGLFSRELTAKPVVVKDFCDESELIEQHNQIARKLGVATKKTPTYSLAGVLADLGIMAYGRAKVEKYMDKKGYWKWYPLRARDVNSAMIPRVTRHNFELLYGGMGSTQYGEIVPLPVLFTIEKIIEKAPRAQFFVAAPDKDPDPFLAVLDLVDGDGSIYVIERWDEPGFRS